MARERFWPAGEEPGGNPAEDPDYPSGPWVGFYTYYSLPSAGRHRMDLTLRFCEGTITGDGIDPVGRFVLRGGYDRETGKCHWVKSYIGAHSVYYQGYRDGRGIWGSWEIPPANRGGFHIWPKGIGEAEIAADEIEVAEEEVLVVGPTFPGGPPRP